MNEINHYAPPKTDALDAVSAKDVKAQRTNLINRRTVALLIDGIPYAILVAIPLSTAMKGGHEPFPGASWLIQAPVYLFRDAFGSVGFGKRLAGLGIVDDASGGPATRAARILRGLPMVIPIVTLVEYFVAFYGSATMQRMGDMLAKTRVVDLETERLGKSSWTWQLLLVLAVTTSIYLIEHALLHQLFMPR